MFSYKIKVMWHSVKCLPERKEYRLKTDAYPKLGEYIIKTLVELIDDNPGQYAYGGVDDIIESIKWHQENDSKRDSSMA